MGELDLDKIRLLERVRLVRFDGARCSILIQSLVASVEMGGNSSVFSVSNCFVIPRRKLDARCTRGVHARMGALKKGCAHEEVHSRRGVGHCKAMNRKWGESWGGLGGGA